MSDIIANRGFNHKIYRDYVIQVEPLEKCILELMNLHKQQWLEIEEERPSYRPNYLPFIESESNGRFFQICIRKNSELVGGIGFFLFESMHTSLLTANETALYIKPEHRKGMLAVSLCNYADDILKKIDVSEVILTVKAYANTGKLIERMGYKKTDVVYMKNLMS